jgi:hypothetical protein
MMTALTTGRGAAALCAALAYALALGSAAATPTGPITEPAGNFLPSYTGPQNSDLDVLSADAVYTGTDYILSATLAGAVGTTPGALYVWGFDRGQGTARFAAIAPGVTFDSVVSISVGGTTAVRDLISGAATTLAASAVTVSGDSVAVDVSAALLLSEGLAPDAYLVNLWPRLGSGNNNQISEFVPTDSDFQVRFVPEPASAALLAAALAGVAMIRRPARARSAV